MSNSKQIITKSLVVDNLDVKTINWKPYVYNPCSNPCVKGYYITPECVEDDNGCSVPKVGECGELIGDIHEVYYCGSCEGEYTPSDCDIYVSCENSGSGNVPGPPGPPGPTGPVFASSALNFYSELQSGAENVTGGFGPGYTIDTPIIDGSATLCSFVYPNNAYFCELGGGAYSWTSFATGTDGVYNNQSDTYVFYKMPYAGNITGISLNAFSWFDSSNGQPDIIIANNTTYRGAGINFQPFSTTNPVFPISGYTTTVNNPSFLAGEGLAFVVKQEPSPVTAWSLPFAPAIGILNITVYVKFEIPT